MKFVCLFSEYETKTKECKMNKFLKLGIGAVAGSGVGAVLAGIPAVIISGTIAVALGVTLGVVGLFQN